MQEVTQHMDALPARMPGHYHRLPWPGRIHGLAVWSRHNFPTPQVLPLPASPLPGRLPQRRSQIVQIGDITFANVHLSHGQLLNRRQLMRIAATLQGKPSAIIGDYNAVGPVSFPASPTWALGKSTHFGGDVVPFRLDRCLAHGLACSFTGTLDFGPSDHKPIVLDLQVAEARAKTPRFSARPPSPGQDPRGFSLTYCWERASEIRLQQAGGVVAQPVWRGKRLRFPPV